MFSISLAAQNVSLRGVATDSSAATVAGAKIVLTREGRALKPQLSDARGMYLIENLPMKDK